MAQAWDVLRGDTSDWPDRAFYLEVIRKSGQPVLDVGCGTGRLLLDYLLQGIDIDGVDNSPEMLALCEQKARTLGLSPVLYEQYLETMSLPRQYQTILVPSSTFQLIIDPGHAKEGLKRLYDHLLPGGALSASFMTLWKEGDPLYTEWEKTGERASDGAMFRRVSRAWYDPDTELEDTEDLYQLIVNGKVVQEETHRRSPATRSYTQNEARALFEEIGFETVELFSEFSFEPVKADDDLFSVVALKGRNL
jgi:SAM-dependent methyltransferase